VAGLFYAGDRRRLQADVSELLGAVKSPAGILPKALIAPHAGYVYSGPVAAQAFATLRERAQSVKRVVLIGPAHFVPLRGIAAPTVDAFETPLGRVGVDRHALSAIADAVVEADAPRSNCPSCKRCCPPSRWFRW
jgi:MEMO1 family protein